MQEGTEFRWANKKEIEALKLGEVGEKKAEALKFGEVQKIKVNEGVQGSMPINQLTLNCG